MAINEFILTEVSKIVSNKEFEFPLNHAMASAWIISNFKGENLKIFDMRGTSSLCDFAILGTAQNTTQARAMADEISAQLKHQDGHILSFEGYESADWILIDTGDVIVHIFNGPAREVYDLDSVFQKKPQIKIPEEFYFSTPARAASEKSDLKGFF
jgi:ribosome-associated protein